MIDDSDETELPSARSRLEDLLVRWEEMREQGENLSAEELCANCPELAPELARRIALLREMEPLFTPSSTMPDSAGSGSSRSHRSRDSARARSEYSDLRFHAAGGLGEVFVARNAELNREVALKFIRPERAGEAESLRRFLLEAEVTGRLEHPGIVPVYALGLDDDGQPCYAMRFIRGDTLQDAIDALHQGDSEGRDDSSRPAALRSLLRRFVSACNTVAYAHSRGMLHRDIKPRNIMLGPFDETLVVDWGLAKPFAKGADPDAFGDNILKPGTSGGSATPTYGIVGTPNYMSPEQAEGRAEAVGPSSDIYSLGATLYAILTGQSPFQGSQVVELLEKVKKGHFPPPRQVNPDVPQALEAICLKAMTLEPTSRYASALDLAADVDRWVADEPVSAWREPWTVRLARWARRHKSSVATAMAILLTVAVALAVSTVLIGRKQAETDAARLQAESSFREAQDAVDRYLTQVSQSTLLKVPGLQALRKELLGTAKTFYEQFVRERGEDHKVRSQLALAYMNLAKIEEELGSREEAITLNSRATGVFNELLSGTAGLSGPERLRTESNLAKCYANEGLLFRKLGRLPESAAAFDRAEALSGRLATNNADDDDIQSVFAKILIQIGLSATDSNDHARAETSLLRAVQIMANNASRRPDDLARRAELASARAYLAMTYSRRNVLDRAKEEIEAAIRDWEALEKADPREYRYSNTLASNLWVLSSIEYNAGRLTQAEATIRRAIEIRERLARENPAFIDLQSDLAIAYGRMADICALMNRSAEAESYHSKAIPIYQRLVRERPREPAPRHGLAYQLYTLAAQAAPNTPPERVAANLRESIRITDGLILEAPSDPSYRGLNATCLLLLARTLHKSSQYADADEALKKGMAATDEIFRRDPTNAANVDVRYDRIFALLDLGHHDEAFRESELTKGRKLSPAKVYNLACAFALAHAEALQPKRPRKDGETDPADACALQVLAFLDEARAAGYFGQPGAVEHVKADPDLTSLRGRADFEAFLKGLDRGGQP